MDLSLRLAGKIFNYVLTTLLVVLVLLASFLTISARSSTDRVPTIAGHKVLNVLSGSMAPAIRTGDVIVVRPLLPGEVPKEGDVITYRVQGETARNREMMITHRVMGTVLVNGKPVAFATKGDANDSPDETPVALQAIVGVYRFRVPFFGYVAYFVRQPVGIVLMLVVPGLFLIGTELRKVYKILLEAEAQEKAKKAARLAGGGSSPQ